MAITRIIPEFRSDDLAATEDLYCNVIGLQVSMRDEPAFVMFGSADVPTAQLIVNDNGHVGLPPGFAIDVDDPAQVDAIHTAVVERGLAVSNRSAPSHRVSDASPSSTTTGSG